MRAVGQIFPMETTNAMEITNESNLSNEIEKKEVKNPIEREGYTLKRGHEARKKAEEEGVELTWTKKKRRRCGRNKNKKPGDNQNAENNGIVIFPKFLKLI